MTVCVARTKAKGIVSPVNLTGAGGESRFSFDSKPMKNYISQSQIGPLVTVNVS